MDINLLENQTENNFNNNFENNYIDNNLNQNIDNNFLDNEVTVEKQNNFLESAIGNAINTGINLALRVVLPDLIENQIIEVKDALMKQGLKEGIKSLVNSAIDLGKSAIGIFSGKFENVSQVQMAVKNGGILDSTSNLLNKAIDGAKKSKMIDSSTATLLKRGKTAILESVNNNIEDLMTSQIKSIEKINKYSENWNSYFKEQDFPNMQKEYKKLQNELKNIVPIENTIKNARKIENLHELIKNKGVDFNLSKEEIELSEKLA